VASARHPVRAALLCVFVAELDIDYLRCLICLDSACGREPTYARQASNIAAIAGYTQGSVQSCVASIFCVELTSLLDEQQLSGSLMRARR
jgi:hypothetical protein